MSFLPAPPDMRYQLSPFQSGRYDDMCVVATVPTEARFGPRDIVVPEVGVEDIVVGALLKDMPKNHTHKELN